MMTDWCFAFHSSFSLSKLRRLVVCGVGQARKCLISLRNGRKHLSQAAISISSESDIKFKFNDSSLCNDLNSRELFFWSLLLPRNAASFFYFYKLHGWLGAINSEWFNFFFAH
ncbi:hypothetical protein VP01_930g1 [Puccinia sorghi]|uniref:Uncharacterized protein n=1 Tax=Puccinia sorghi TaxID=27349 RepID=A0A0L6U925_9BASI|nr:hypothetical protein VP01_930g1 [Puccinia sorghi]